MADINNMAGFVKLRDQSQQMRLAEMSRLRTNPPTSDKLKEVHWSIIEHLATIEKQVVKLLKEEVTQDPAWPWLEQVRGVGVTLAAQILAYIDWEKAPRVSNLWSYAGLAVNDDGKAPRRHRGEKFNWNPHLKTVMYKWAGNQLKNDGPYAQVYRDARYRYETARDWTPIHCHLAALRVAEKHFLADLWMVSRYARSLPISKPWVLEYGGTGHDWIGPWARIGQPMEDKVLLEAMEAGE